MMGLCTELFVHHCCVNDCPNSSRRTVITGVEKFMTGVL